MKVLIVDDEPSIRYLFTEFLKMKGFDTDEAENGMEGLKKFHKDNYDLLILDIKMGFKNGIELLEDIRRHGYNTPVIVCTAYKHLEEDVRITSSENVEFLEKPVDLQKLWEKVEKLLGMKTNAG